MLDLSFDFQAECWLWQAKKAAWHFVTLPIEQSQEIKFFHEGQSLKKRGWGAVKVKATVGVTSWETSIFPSKAFDAYILPIKATVRKHENIEINQVINVHLAIKL